MKSFSRWVAIVSVLLVGAGISIAARNSSGTYSLPSGNPVTSGSIISSSWANTTLADIATGVTDSLDRYGRGSMQAPLKSVDGTETAPGLTFSSEQTSGLYRAGSGDVRLSALGADVAQWSATGEVLTGDLSVSGDATVSGAIGATGLTSSAGATITQSSLNAAGLTAYGNGTGSGVVGSGGSGGGVGGDFGASGAGWGLRASSSGTGYGAFISASGAEALYVRGGAGKAGALLEAGTAATSTTPQDAARLIFGYLNLDGVAVPASTTAIKNRLTPSNIIKAWGTINCTTSGCSVVSGFNIAGVSVSGENVQINLAQNVTSGAVTVSLESGTNVSAVRASLSAGDVSAGFYNGTTHVNVSSLSSVTTFDFIATGVQ